jgi:hypothetical protein
MNRKGIDLNGKEASDMTDEKLEIAKRLRNKLDNIDLQIKALEERRLNSCTLNLKSKLER